MPCVSTLPWKALTWSSSDESLATVDQTGLVTGTGRGVVTISVSAAGLTDSVDIRIVGEGGAFGNNLSWPVVFASPLTGQARRCRTGESVRR